MVPRPTKILRGAALIGRLRGRSARRLAAAAGLALALLAPASGLAGGAASLLEQHGIRALAPPPPAADFRLPALQGEIHSLSEARGRWLVVTFFATWCGPCRVEMPTLERLHRDLGAAAGGGQGIAVLGVSIDDRREPVGPFLRQLGITFPVLWDERGEAARAYRASSIPVSFLIDPAGRVQGVSRGARDWSALSGLLGQLADLEPPAPGSEPAAAAADLALPEEIEPPTATAELVPPEPTVGRPFHLDVHVRWAGSLDRYVLLPPSLSLPEGVEQRGMSAETTSEAGRAALTYRVALAARRPGEYALTPLEVRYAPHGSAEPLASRIEGPTVRVRPRTLAGLPPAAFAGAGGATVALGLLAFALVERRRRRPAPPATETLLPALQEALAEARRQRLSGAGAASFLTLARLERELGVAEEDRSRLEAAEEAARYGAEAPSSGELEYRFRRIERRLGELAAQAPIPTPRRGRRARRRREDSLQSRLTEERR